MYKLLQTKFSKACGAALGWCDQNAKDHSQIDVLVIEKLMFSI